MKNFIILFQFLTVTLFCNAQDAFYKIDYEMNMDNFINHLKEQGKDSQSIFQTFQSSAEAAKEITLELLVANNISFFNERKSLSINESENLKKLIAVGFSFEGGWLYDLLKKDLIFIKEQENKKFYVRKNKPMANWNLSNETKTILGYTCYKATYTRSVPSGNYEITAWFTKEIPLPFGPANYSGQLPGLILELNEVNATYRATKVEKKDKFTIKWPAEKEVISEDDYKNKGDNYYETIKKMN